MTGGTAEIKRLKRTVDIPPLVKKCFPCLIALLFSGCLVSETSYQTLQESKDALVEESKELKEKNKEAEKQIDTLEKDVQAKEKLLQESKDTKAKLETLEKEQQKLKEEFDAYRNKYRTATRTKAAGEKIASLSTTNGQTYNQVVLRRVDPDGIYILHDAGGTKLSFAQLSPEWSQRFDFDAAEAEAYARETIQKKAPSQTVITDSPSAAPIPTIITPTAPVAAAPIAAAPIPAAAITTTPVNQAAESPATGNDAKIQKLGSLRQELRDEITRIFSKMENHRRDHYKEKDGVHEAGVYIATHSYSSYSSYNSYNSDYNYQRGGKKPGMNVDLDNDFDQEYPENSGCFDVVALSMTLSHARDLRLEINNLKHELGIKN